MRRRGSRAGALVVATLWPWRGDAGGRGIGRRVIEAMNGADDVVTWRGHV